MFHRLRCFRFHMIETFNEFQFQGVVSLQELELQRSSVEPPTSPIVELGSFSWTCFSLNRTMASAPNFSSATFFCNSTGLNCTGLGDCLLLLCKSPSSTSTHWIPGRPPWDGRTSGPRTVRSVSRTAFVVCPITGRRWDHLRAS